jgi:hypothetical protein
VQLDTPVKLAKLVLLAKPVILEQRGQLDILVKPEIRAISELLVLLVLLVELGLPGLLVQLVKLV